MVLSRGRRERDPLVRKGNARVKIPPASEPVTISPAQSTCVCLLAAAVVLAAGCAEPVQQPVVLFPAADQQADLRKFTTIQPYSDVKPSDAIVRIVGDVTCTGTLIAEDLVLTAHHCVAARDQKGNVLPRDKAPSELTVEIGDDDLPWAEVGVKVVVSPDCGYVSGAGDIAVLVLQRKLIGMLTYPARLDRPPGPSETLKPIGFGRCANSGPFPRRSSLRAMRAADPVARVLPDYFVAQASICPGDSGGPVLVERIDRGGVITEVVGVVSASAMDGDDRTADVSLFTRLDPWKEIFSAAREIADGASPSEVLSRACK